MTDARCILKRYYDILEDADTAQFLRTQEIPVSFSKSESTKSLWKKHDRTVEQRSHTLSNKQKNLLDLKIELAQRMYTACTMCEHRCRIDRTATQGYCGVQQSYIASEFLHYGEEPDLVPSYTVFFAGCTFQCVFCQNYDISRQQCGRYLEPKVLGKVIKTRQQQGAKNVNWVGGDPTPHLLYVLSVLKQTSANIPMIWNSNMYCSEETMKLLNRVIDVYLTDFKYGNDRCAQRLSKIEKYLFYIQRNHHMSYTQGEVIVRHLVLPNHTTCCSKPILRWIAEEIPESMVNIMDQYRPCYQASDYIDIAQRLSQREYNDVYAYADTLGLHCF